ncbi:hypothetical protein VP01_389g1 [Puccinia sorghi]|uniref:Uncharacterized protein n=1 Tax=Puccinia sorghi TaxID=27349 RepID=A0A0L6USQ5_9BASI|nr:hypothetical protein VP01_389g1 [Puccinia sorghi]
MIKPVAGKSLKKRKLQMRLRRRSGLRRPRLKKIRVSIVRRRNRRRMKLKKKPKKKPRSRLNKKRRRKQKNKLRLRQNRNNAKRRSVNGKQRKSRRQRNWQAKEAQSPAEVKSSKSNDASVQLHQLCLPNRLVVLLYPPAVPSVTSLPSALPSARKIEGLGIEHLCCSSFCKEKPVQLSDLDLIGLVYAHNAGMTPMSRNQSTGGQRANAGQMPPCRGPPCHVINLLAANGQMRDRCRLVAVLQVRLLPLFPAGLVNRAGPDSAFMSAIPIGMGLMLLGQPTGQMLHSPSTNALPGIMSNGAQDTCQHSGRGSRQDGAPGRSMQTMFPVEVVQPLQPSANSWAAARTTQLEENSPELVYWKVKALLNKLTLDKFQNTMVEFLGKDLCQALLKLAGSGWQQSTWRSAVPEISAEQFQEEYELGWSKREDLAAAAAGKAANNSKPKARKLQQERQRLFWTSTMQLKKPNNRVLDWSCSLENLYQEATLKHRDAQRGRYRVPELFDDECWWTTQSQKGHQPHEHILVPDAEHVQHSSSIQDVIDTRNNKLPGHNVAAAPKLISQIHEELHGNHFKLKKASKKQMHDLSRGRSRGGRNREQRGGGNAGVDQPPQSVSLLFISLVKSQCKLFNIHLYHSFSPGALLPMLSISFVSSMSLTPNVHLYHFFPPRALLPTLALSSLSLIDAISMENGKKLSIYSSGFYSTFDQKAGRHVRLPMKLLTQSAKLPEYGILLPLKYSIPPI